MKKEIVIYGKTYVLKEETTTKQEFKVGDWVKIHKPDSGCVSDNYLGKVCRILNMHGITRGDIYDLTVDIDHNDNGCLYISDQTAKLATDSEIKDHLISEAKRRYPVGTRFIAIESQNEHIVTGNPYGSISYKKCIAVPIEEGSNFSGCVVYNEDGKWAEIIKEKPIKIGGYEVEFKNGEIKVGCKTIPNKYVHSIKEIFDLGRILDDRTDNYTLEFDDGKSVDFNEYALDEIIENLKE